MYFKIIFSPIIFLRVGMGWGWKGGSRADLPGDTVVRMLYMYNKDITISIMCRYTMSSVVNYSRSISRAPVLHNSLVSIILNQAGH